MKFVDRLDEATEAARRLKPYNNTCAEIKWAAKDIATVLVFLDTTLPKFIVELRAVTDEIKK
jgi:hypothetical protein